MANITVNKNTVPGDKSALIPSGLRLGAPALTTRGLVERDFEQVVNFLDRGVEITADIKSKVSGASRSRGWPRGQRCAVGPGAGVPHTPHRAAGKKLRDFNAALEAEEHPEIAALGREVAEWARGFPTIGFDAAEMRYPE